MICYMEVTSLTQADLLSKTEVLEMIFSVSFLKVIDDCLFLLKFNFCPTICAV